MARIARVVVSGVPHHVIQRGNRRLPVFFRDTDRQAYLSYLKESSEEFGIDYWAYCLMDNYVHLIAVPKREDSLSKGVGEAHKSYTRLVNFREGWRGHLWQGRFSSYPLDEPYLYAAIRYVERNPVRARLVKKAEDYPWSSAKAHVFGIKDPFLSEHFLKAEIRDWSTFLSEGDGEDQNRFELHSRTGRPCGDKGFFDRLEKTTGRILRKRKPGPKLGQ